MVRYRISIVRYHTVVAALVVLLLGCGGRQEPPKAETAPAPLTGRITASIQPSAVELGPNVPYTIVYALSNPTRAGVKVDRIVTAGGTINSLSPGWQQGNVEPGETVTIARASAHAGAAGVQNLTASFFTDRGTFDAAPARVTVTPALGAAPPPGATGGGMPVSGNVVAQLAIAPNPTLPGQPATISYELIDSTNDDILVSSIQFDSTFPLMFGNPAWLGNKVAAHSKFAVARRTVVRNDPGQYTFTGHFATNKGMFNAEPAVLVVAPPEEAKDTGHVNVAIAISPNPVPLGEAYRIEYEVVNTTRREVTVTGISTDFGTIDATSTEWLTGTAPAGRTTTIAHVAGEGAAATSRNKTGTFQTSEGNLTASPVMLVIQ